MVENAKLMLQSDGLLDLRDGVIASYEENGTVYEIRIKDIEKYWPYANGDDLEGADIRTDGRYVILLLTTASDQGGAVAVWDADVQDIVHISDGAYGIASSIYEGSVYVLRAVHNFMVPLNYIMTKTAFGTMDAFDEGVVDEGFLYDEEGACDAAHSGIPVYLKVDADSYVVSYGGQESIVSRSA